MPFLRVLRDRRGVEHTYLMDLARSRGKQRPRVLYVFRTVPGTKLGRDPFDPDTRHRIEQANPGLVFDWDALVRSIPPPEPDAETRRFVRRSRRPPKPGDTVRRAAVETEKAEPAPPARREAPRDASRDARRVPDEALPSSDEPTEARDDQARDEEARRGPRFPTEIEGATTGSKLAWLRVCHAETVARIEQEILDEPRRSEMLAAAARLNPAGWRDPDATDAGFADATRALGELARAFTRAPRRQGGA